MKIYTTQDSQIQKICDTELSNDENYPYAIQYAINWAWSVQNPDGTVDNYDESDIQTYHKKVLGETNFKLLFNSKEEAKQRAIDLLAEVGISRPEKVVDNYPFQLSGGMCQRVMIAMALSCHPKLLIADEPTTALDVTIQAQILSLMNRLKNETGTSIMLITHDLGVVAQVADNVNVMYAGKVVETAPVEELFNNPKHPYTIGLMNSMPSLAEEGKRLNTIEGSVPNPLYLPKGCYFADRCPYVTDRCKEGQPVDTKVKSRHHVWCFKVEEEMKQEG